MTMILSFSRIAFIPAGMFVLLCATAACTGGSRTGAASLSDLTDHKRATSLSSQLALDRAKDLAKQAEDLYEHARYGSALSVAHEALALREKHLRSDDLLIADSYTTIGLIHLWQADNTQAEKAFSNALRIRERRLGSHHVLVAGSLGHLGRIYLEMGKIDAAQPILQQAFDLRRSLLGDRHVDVAASLNALGQIRIIKGDLKGAQDAFAEAAQIISNSGDRRPSDLGWALNGLAQVRRRVGDIIGARKLAEEALRVRQEAFGAAHPEVTRTLVSLIEIMQQIGEVKEAIPLAEKVLRLDEATFGTDHPTVALRLNILAQLKADTEAVNEALQLRKRALQIQTRVLGTKHYLLGQTMIETAMLHMRVNEPDEAIRLFEQAILIQEESLGRDNVYLANGLDYLGALYASKGEHGQAQALFERSLKIRLASYGSEHPDIAISLASLARIFHVRGELNKARPLYERAREISMGLGRVDMDLDDSFIRRKWQQDSETLRDYARLLFSLAKQSNGQSAGSDAFLVLEQARGWVVQSTVAKLLARRAAHTAEERVLISHVEQLRHERNRLWDRLRELYGAPLEGDKQDEMDQIKKDVARLQRLLDEAAAKIQATIPQYAELARPNPITVSAVQDLLEDDEALISYYYMDQGLKVWVIRRGQPLFFHEVAVEKTTLMRLVQEVRQSLSPDYGAFHVAASAQLYQYLVRPVEPALGGIKHLFVVPDQILIPLPFAALITRLGSHPAASTQAAQSPVSLARMDYSMLSWLVRKYATTMLPSASTLRLLRRAGGESSHPHTPFIGFGDPVFSADSQDQPAIPTTAAAPLGLTERRLKQLHMLSRLPGTQQELVTAARALKADPVRDLYLAERATETQVKRLNAEGTLGQAEVISFATHALIAGELQGITQPTLVMTPPKTATETDDGMLSMEEVLDLQLPHTSWVILSACNTGASENAGEGLSGLARAFFYAGAKSLLVSHWSVDDRATKVLMGEILKRYGGDRRVSSAEAVRQGMLALLEHHTDDDYIYLSHPYAWASFFLVGEGRRRHVTEMFEKSGK